MNPETNPSRDTATGWRDFGDDWFTPGRFALVLGLLLFAVFPGVVLGTQSFCYRDYGFLAYPFFFFHRECFWSGDLLPFWNPYVNCGAPYLAQWNTLTLYPGSLLFLLPPMPWSLGFFCLAHLFLGGLGMYALARRWTGRRFVAAFAGTAFVFNGVVLTCHIYPNYLATLGWLPWVVLFTERAWREGGRMIVAAALAGAMQMLTGAPEILLLTWLLLGVLAGGEVPGSKFKVQSWRSVLGRFALVVLLITGLTAVQMLPFFELLAQSQRDRNTGGAFWSLPGWGWANFFVPLFHCFRTAQGIFVQAKQAFLPSYYLGVGVLALALVALWRVRERRVWLLAGVTTFCLLLALGENGFLHPWLAGIVPIGVSRYPIKFVALAAFTVPLLAALGLNWWLTRKLEERALAMKRIGGVGVWLLVVMAGIVVWADRSRMRTDDFTATWQNAVVRAVFLAGVLGTVLLAARAERPQSRWLAQLGVLLLLALDALTHSPKQNPTIAASAFEPETIRQYLRLTPEPRLGESRVMLSPRAEADMHVKMVPDFRNDFLGQRAALWGNLNHLDHLPKVNGASTLLTREQAEFDRLLYGTLTNEYPRLLDFLAVSHTTAPGETMRWTARTNYLPLITGGQRAVFGIGAEIIQALKDPAFDPRAIVLLPTELESQVRITNQTNVRILSSQFLLQRVRTDVEVSEPSLVVIAQSYERNWRATVDGSDALCLRANHAFTAVKVPPGRHTVELHYRSRAFGPGALVTGMTLLGCVLAWRRMGLISD